ncbi:MAG: hypothetical protein AB1384_11260 [Actinomycetota bacterium]
MTKRAFFLAITLTTLLAVVLALAGCGGKEQSLDESFQAATQAARDAGSAHAQINASLSPLEGEGGMGLNVQGDAWMDMDAGALEARFTVLGMEVSLRYVDGTAYVQFGGGWYVLQGELMEDIDEGTIDALVGLLSSIPEIISSTVELNEVGEKSVGDYECVEVELVPDLPAIMALDPVRKLVGELDMSEDEALEYLEEADIAIEVYIQKDEPVIRRAYLAATMELPAMGDIVGIPLLPEVARIEVTVDFPEYGVEVDVKAPEDAKPFEGL